MSKIADYIIELQDKEAGYGGYVDIDTAIASLSGVADRIIDVVIFGSELQTGQKVRTNGPQHWQQGHYGVVVTPGKIRTEIEYASGEREKWPNAWLQLHG